MIAEPRPSPTADRAEAFERFAVLRRADDALVLPAAISRCYPQSERCSIAVVLLHGFTNNPEQYAVLAPQLHARGHAVVVPRLPGHGDRDRRGLRLKAARAEAWLATTQEAIDIACGLGRRVVVAGISLGGALAARLAVGRADVARAVAIAPYFGIRPLGRVANQVLERVLTLGPNLSIPWDPFGDGASIPVYGYPAFPTRALGQSLRVGLDVLGAASAGAPACGDVLVMTNAHDPAVENPLADAAVRAWNAHRPGSALSFVFENLPVNHDILDPTNPMRRLEIVYPKVIEAIEAAS